MKYKLLLLHHLPPPIHGSSLIGQQILNCRFLKTYFDIEYINLLASQKVKDSGRLDSKKIKSFIFIFFELIYKLIFHRPGICYFALTTTGLAFYRDALLVSILKIFHVPIIYHLHNKGVRGNANNWVKYQLYRFVFNGSEVILLSELLYNDIEQFVKRGDVYICPNGVSDVNIIPDFKGKPTLLFLSNFICSKGVLDLVDAAYILASRGLEFYFNLVGSDGDITKRELEDIISAKGLSCNINVIGPQYGSFKYRAFANASFFVFPTYNDCFPLVLLEAMQALLPIISTFEGGIPDIVEDGVTGFLVPQRDIVALADRMEQLILNPELCQQMGAAGRKRYEELFTAEIFENRITEILQEVSLKYT